MPPQAVQAPTARPRSSGGKVDTITASAAGVSSAPATPCSARARHQHLDRRRERAQQRGGAEAEHAEREHAPLAEDVAERAADQQQRAERDAGRRSTVHCWPARPPPRSSRDRGQRDVDHRRVDRDDGRAEDRRDQYEPLARGGQAATAPAWRPPSGSGGSPLTDVAAARRARPDVAARVGRISRPSRFCSRMCAAQPATRAQENIGVNSSGGTCGVVEHDRRPELDVRGQHAVGLARLQLGQRGLLELLRRPRAAARRSRAPCGAARARAGPRRGRRGGRSPSAGRPGRARRLTQRSASPSASTSSSICSTREGAPPCSGPDSAPTPRRQGGGHVGAGGGDHARGEGRRVHAVLGRRDPVGVDRLDVVAGRPRRASGSGSARGSTCALSTSRCGTGGRPMPRADWATKESAITDTRARSSRACSSSMSISAWSPHSGAEHRQRGLEVRARVAGAHRQRVRLGGRHAGLEAAVHQQAPDLLERHAADELLDVDAAVAQRAALLVGLRDRRVEGDDALEPGGDLDQISHCPRGYSAGAAA